MLVPVGNEILYIFSSYKCCNDESRANGLSTVKGLQGGQELGCPPAPTATMDSHKTDGTALRPALVFAPPASCLDGPAAIRSPSTYLRLGLAWPGAGRRRVVSRALTDVPCALHACVSQRRAMTTSRGPCCPSRPASLSRSACRRPRSSAYPRVQWYPACTAGTTATHAHAHAPLHEWHAAPARGAVPLCVC